MRLRSRSVGNNNNQEDSLNTTLSMPNIPVEESVPDTNIESEIDTRIEPTMDRLNIVQITKLNQVNFSDWKEQIKDLLALNDCLEAVTSEQVVTDKVARKARLLIVTNIDSSLNHVYSGKTSAKEIFEALKNHFEKKNVVKESNLRKDLAAFKFRNPHKFDDDIAKFTKLLNDLQICSDGVTENSRISHLLSSLPDEYETLVSNIELKLVGKETLSYIDVVEMARNRAKRIQTNVEEVHNTSIRRPVKCFYCGKIGHRQQDCFFMKNNQKERNNDDKSKRSGEKSNKHLVKRNEHIKSIDLEETKPV